MVSIHIRPEKVQLEFVLIFAVLSHHVQLDDFPASSYTEPLSHSLSVERAEETRMMRALSYTSEPLPPSKRAISAGKDVSGGR